MLDTKTNFVDEKVEIDPKDLQVSFDNNTTETKDEKTNNDSKIVKVSLGNDSEALAEEKNKPKEKQDENKIKQLEKSIKDREKQIKNKVKNNKKLKPGSNVWDGIIDDENADDWSYILNKWKNIPEKEDFKSAAEERITQDTKNFDKDREWSLNLTQEGFDEWNSYQENPDDADNYEKYKKEKEEWINKVDKAINKYSPYKKGDPKYYSAISVYKAFTAAKEAGDYDAAAILKRATYNALENEKAQKENEATKTTPEKTVKEEGKQTFTKEKAWEIYNSPSGTAKGLFEDFKTLGMDAVEAKKEFLNKNPNPSQNAKNAFRNVYKSELVESKVITDEETNEKNTTTPQQTQSFHVGQAPRKVLNEAQSETSKNIKDVILDETYQTLTDDEKRDALKKATEKALNKYSSSFIDKANTRENAAQLSKFLPRFAIQHFLEGDFGDKKDPKSWGTLGYFLLDKVGKSLINASQVARGFSPTEKTALENYNETMMKNAFGRDDENRKKILNSSLDTLVKDSDILREVGISDFKIFDDFTEKVLTQYQDNIQNVNLDKILKEKSDFILNMPSEEQQKFIGYLIAMDVSEPGSAAYLNAAYRAADMEQRFAKADAEKYAAQK